MFRATVSASLCAGLIAFAMLPGTATASAAATCDGVPATLIGTEGDDYLVGTPGNDVIAALGGNDIVIGLEGADRICAGPGNDIVAGSNGADRIFGEAGGDSLFGGNGDDQIFGGAGADTLIGNFGDDELAGNDGDDALIGEQGDDNLIGDGGDDTLDAGADTDECDGRTGNDYYANCEVQELAEPQPASGELTFVSDGAERSYYLKLPSNYTPGGEPLPVIFAFHGTGASHLQWFFSWGFGDGLQTVVGDQAVIVFPNALPASNGIKQWDYDVDFRFFENLLGEVRGLVEIDEQRIFATGHSSGGAFVHELGCRYGDVLRAIAPSAGTLVSSECTGAVAVLQIQGDMDTKFPVELGEPARDFWIAYNGFDAGTSNEGIDPFCADYSLGAADWPVQYCEHSELGNNGHQWWSGADQAIWSFFSSLSNENPAPLPPPGGGNGMVPAPVTTTLSFTLVYSAILEPVRHGSIVLYPEGTTGDVGSAPLRYLNPDFDIDPALPGTVRSYTVPITLPVPGATPSLTFPGRYAIGIRVHVDGGSYVFPASGVDHSAFVSLEITDNTTPVSIVAPMFIGENVPIAVTLSDPEMDDGPAGSGGSWIVSDEVNTAFDGAGGVTVARTAAGQDVTLVDNNVQGLKPDTYYRLSVGYSGYGVASVALGGEIAGIAPVIDNLTYETIVKTPVTPSNTLTITVLWGALFQLSGPVSLTELGDTVTLQDPLLISDCNGAWTCSLNGDGYPAFGPGYVEIHAGGSHGNASIRDFGVQGVLPGATYRISWLYTWIEPGTGAAFQVDFAGNGAPCISTPVNELIITGGTEALHALTFGGDWSCNFNTGRIRFVGPITIERISSQ